MTTILREKTFRLFTKKALALKMALEQKKDIYAKIEGEQVFIPYTNDSDIYSGLSSAVGMVSISRDGQAILFSAEQAQVFTTAHKTYFDMLDYKLPFPKVFLQFDRPVEVEYQKRSSGDIDRSKLVVVALEQQELTESEYNDDKNRVNENYRQFGMEFTPKFRSFQFNETGKVIVNRMVFLYQDAGFEHVIWQSSCTDESLEDFDPIRADAIKLWKNIAIACIGYINCENVRLERIEQADEATNAKRERKGKSRLEPYYVCRIRGVQHDSVATGTGAKHGIRYDVRGHFRRLVSGKTIWVKAHQRGLQNELYVPKTYLVEKGVKDNGRR